MTRAVKQIPTVRRVNVEENARDHDRLLLQKFFEEGLCERKS